MPNMSFSKELDGFIRSKPNQAQVWAGFDDSG